MEQGKIDQILSSRPEERRYLFEEAAGITRYKVKSAEAERKLQRTEENMRQVEGILGEVKRSYDTLKVQADKTIKYRALREEIFNFELDIQLLKLKQFRYDKARRDEELSRAAARRDAIEAELAAVNRSLEENMDVVNSMEAELIECQKNIYGLAVEKNAGEKEVRLLTEQRNESRGKIQQNEARERAVKIKIEELLGDAEEQDGVVRDLRKKAEDIGKNITSFEENVRLASARIGENEAGILRAEEDIRAAIEERADREKALEEITDDIVSALDSGLREAGYSASERRNLEAELSETLGRLKTLLSGREALIHDLAQAAEQAEEGGSLPGPERLKSIAGGLVHSLSEAAAHSEKAAGLFERYRQSTPAFIDEFLAPEGIITKKRALDAMIRETRERETERRRRIEEYRRDTETLNGKIDEYRATLEELRVSRVRMDTQAQSAEEQAKLIRRELSGQEGLLKTVGEELFLDRRRQEELDERIEDTEEQLRDIEKRGVKLTGDLEKLEKEISRKNGDLVGKQEAIKKRREDLSRVQEDLEKIHLGIVQSETEIRNIQDNFRETHSRDLMEFEERIFTITAAAAELRERLANSRNSLRELGSVNLMAPEEFAETKERYDFLSGQIADLSKARDDLERITAEIRAESSELFMAVYNKIKKNFHNMFRHLFDGGRAELRLSDSNHVLESGIEIYAQPPGKKLENITLLSGGEKSMTAVALLFATYMVKPSPFCLLDEIDAALDEQNVLRFVQLLREFGKSSQFIVITHNKKTVTAAGTLLGVAMEESGVTKVISVRLENEQSGQAGAYEPEPFEEEDVEPEEGRELPLGVDDPSLVSEAELRPIRSGNSGRTPPEETPG
jgi:chromosome segregation protein